MQAVIIKNLTTQFLAEIGEIQIPKPTTKDVLIKVQSFPINFFDIQCAMGTQHILRKENLTPGIEGRGKVIKTGEGAQKFLNKHVLFICNPFERDSPGS